MRILLLMLAGLLWWSTAWPSLSWGQLTPPPCTTTLSSPTAATVASTVSAAAAGSTVCVTGTVSGGAISLGSFTKSPVVWLRATTLLGATISGFDMTSGSNGVVLDGFNTGTGNISGSTTRNITIQRNNFGNSPLNILTVNFNNNNILVDFNDFVGFNSEAAGGEQGAIHVVWPGGSGNTVPSGVTLTNNFVNGLTTGCSDGIRSGAYGVVVGPGNIIVNWHQGGCGAHVDGLQGYGQGHTTVTRNFFLNNDIDLGFYDGGNTELFTQNVFANPTTDTLILGVNVAGTFSHNTVRNGVGNLGGGHGSSGANWTVQNNILINTDMRNSLDTAGFNGCGSPCVMSFHMKDAQSTTNPTGTNTISGSPTFINGTPATSCNTRATCLAIWANYQLTSGSIGKNAGSDGTDVGTTYYGSGVTSDTTPPATPTGLAVQ